MTDNINDFNQWSSFFEITHFYGSKTHKGDHQCINRGIVASKLKMIHQLYRDSEAHYIAVK